jgi:hypothetical protein
LPYPEVQWHVDCCGNKHLCPSSKRIDRIIQLQFLGVHTTIHCAITNKMIVKLWLWDLSCFFHGKTWSNLLNLSCLYLLLYSFTVERIYTLCSPFCRASNFWKLLISVVYVILWRHFARVLPLFNVGNEETAAKEQNMIMICLKMRQWRLWRQGAAARFLCWRQQNCLQI